MSTAGNLLTKPVPDRTTHGEVPGAEGTGSGDGGPRLRIAIVAPPWIEVPPRAYGGTEAVVGALVDQLTARGHEVTLVASGEPHTKAAHFVQVYEKPPFDRLGEPIPEVMDAAEAARAIADLDVDVVHDNTLAGPLLARGRDVPTAVTTHGPVTGELGQYYERLGTTIHTIAISDSQRRLNPRLAWAGTVHNAVDVASFPFISRKDDYVLWLGRFSPDKGAHLAIDAARAAGYRIVLAGKLNEPLERKYFESMVRPRLGPDAEYVGEADGTLKRELLSRARCLAFPIQWEEPFGMVMIEALSCGTPVVAMRRGSVPEVIDDGVTGYVVDRNHEFEQALQKADRIDPAACRRAAEQRFDLPVMAAGYERIFRELVRQAA